MLATEGQTTGLENPTSSAALQPETTEAYVWVAPSGLVLTQGGASDGATLEETTGAPNVSDSHVSYLASQLELERGHVWELTQQNLELSRQKKRSSTTAWLARDNARMQGDYGPYGNMGFHDHSYQEHGHLNQGAPKGSLYANTMFQGEEAYHPDDGGYANYIGPYAFVPYCTAQALTYGAGTTHEQSNHGNHILPENRRSRQATRGWVK
ncbi:hypothetical protein FH972_027072 [Carpinus fangiana]|uniref:Uncharacterized protein n=1 Tax=Carpinus fangiana TaxID=176857 RepID=A0A5N6L5X7_9ROSI|nr:hypothetical protein FH972_027072 [Carpinus fangiana]